MRDVLYLAYRYLAYHRIKTAILIASVTMIVYLPVGLNIVVSQSARELTARGGWETTTKSNYLYLAWLQFTGESEAP